MERRESKDDEEQFSLHPATNLYTIEQLVSDLSLIRNLQQKAKRIGKMPHKRTGIYRDLRRLQDGSYDYKNGHECAVEGCKFKDVVFHHLDYVNNLGIHLCWLHHSMQHLDQVAFGEFILMMAARGLTKFSIELGKDSVKLDMKPKEFRQFPIFAIEMHEGEAVVCLR
jgi:hypothetical protein